MLSAGPRSLLIGGLLAGRYLLVALIVLGYVLGIGWLVFGMWAGLDFGDAVLMTILTAPFILTPVAALVAHSMLVFRGNPAPPAGAIRVRRWDAPRLWDAVTALAAEVGTRPPTELWLTAQAGAAVNEGAGRRTYRRMYVGMPLLAGLTADELRAVLCHELGHYAQGHTRFGAMIYRGSEALGHARRGIVRDAAARGWAVVFAGVPHSLLSAYTWLYNGVFFAVRRRQELEADATAARVVGGTVAAGALRSAQAITAAWDDFTTRFLAPGATETYTGDPFSAFASMLADAGYREKLAEWRRNPPEPERTRLDPHPGIAARLARLSRFPDPAGPVDTRSAVDLLSKPGKLGGQVWRGRTGRPRSQDAAATAHTARARRIGFIAAGLVTGVVAFLLMIVTFTVIGGIQDGSPARVAVGAFVLLMPPVMVALEKRGPDIRVKIAVVVVIGTVLGLFMAAE